MIQKCGSCAFWDFSNKDERGWSDCLLFSDDPTLDDSRPVPNDAPEALAGTAPFAGADGATFITSEDFGCIQWRSRSASA